MTTPIRRCFALCTLTSLSVICKFQRGSKWGVMKIMSANVDVQIRAARFVCLHVHIEMKLSEHHMTEWTHTLTHSCTIIRAYYRVKHTCCFSLFSTRWCYWWKPCNIHLHQIVADVKRIQFYEQLCLRGNALGASKHLQLPFQTFIHSLICTSDDRQPSPNKLLDQSLASTFGNEPDQALGGVWGEVTRSHVSVTGGTDKPLALYLRGPYKIWGHHHPPESCEPEPLTGFASTGTSCWCWGFLKPWRCEFGCFGYFLFSCWSHSGKLCWYWDLSQLGLQVHFLM